MDKAGQRMLVKDSYIAATGRRHGLTDRHRNVTTLASADIGSGSLKATHGRAPGPRRALHGSARRLAPIPSFLPSTVAACRPVNRRSSRLNLETVAIVSYMLSPCIVFEDYESPTP